MRDSCFNCCRKHLAQAHILSTEARLGYQMHKYLAIGHLAEAEDEMLEFDPELSAYIRSKRKEYEDLDTPFNVMELFQMVDKSEQLHSS